MTKDAGIAGLIRAYVAVQVPVHIAAADAYSTDADHYLTGTGLGRIGNRTLFERTAGYQFNRAHTEMPVYFVRGYTRSS